MADYAVITENDESVWEDITGEYYHFPSIYRRILTSGCNVIYYKGRLLKSMYRESRLSDKPHYFGHARIGAIEADPLSTKGDLFCEIDDYHEFTSAVPINDDGEYLETIAESRRTNHWRFGVRETDQRTYEKIVGLASIRVPAGRKVRLPGLSSELESSRKEGGKKYRYSAYYERNPALRKQALELHGFRCLCGFKFSEKYGIRGRGFIHVHHLKPVSELGQPVLPDPKTDMAVLCANCHAMVHRDKEHTLSLEELRQITI